MLKAASRPARSPTPVAPWACVLSSMTRESVSFSNFMYASQVLMSLGISSWRCLRRTSMLAQALRMLFLTTTRPL